MSNINFKQSNPFQEKRGFALIITISLMAFLVLLLVSLTTLTRVETEMASNSQQMAIARENARMAVNIAIAELQKYAGVDQRTSAPANIWSGLTTPPALTGATAPLPNVLPFLDAAEYLKYVTYWENRPIATRYRHPYWTGIWNLESPTAVPAWLVSGNEFFDVRGQSTYPTGDPNYTYFTPDVPFDTTTNNDIVDLVGVGSVRDADSATPPQWLDGRVRVQKQRIRVAKYPGLPDQTVTASPTTGHVVGHYAYAVLDEGVKASLAAGGNKIPPATPNKFDELTAKLSPPRYGFEHVFNPPDEPTTAPLLYDPNMQEWERVLTRYQALSVPSATTNPSYPSFNNHLWPNFHDMGAHSRGLLTDVVNGGLRIDLSARPDLVDLNQGDYFLAAADIASNTSSTGPKDSIDPDHATNPTFSYPVDWTPMTVGIKPVVKHLRLVGEITPTGLNSPFEVTLLPELAIWNPYTGDFFNNEQGYKIGVRFFYDAASPLFHLRLAAGVHWRHGTVPIVDTYDSWSAATDLELFDVQPGNPPLGTPPTSSYLEFVTAVPTRIQAGEIKVFSGENLDPGLLQPSNTPYDVPSTVFSQDFDPPPPDPSATIIQTIGTLYAPDFPAGQQSATVRIQVFAIPVVGGTDDIANEVVILERDVTATLLGDIVIPPGPFVVQPQWETAWKDPAVNSYVPNTPPDFEPTLDPAVFSIGFDLPDPVSTVVTDPFGFDPRDPTAGTGLDFYELPPDPIPTWPGATAHGFFDIGTGAGAFGTNEDPRYMVMFDLPRTDLTSIGQLRHALRPGDPALLLGEPAPNPSDPARAVNDQMWDQYFFSSLPPTPTSRADAEDNRLNPRMEIRRDKHMDETRLIGNLGKEDLAATGLTVRGAFNVNSTSVKAWALLLRSYSNQELSIWEPTVGTTGEVNVDPLEVHGSYGRFGQSAGLTYFGRPNIAGIGDTRSIWRNGFRELRPLDFSYDFMNPTPSPYAIIWALDQLSPAPLVTSNDREWEYLAEEMARLIVNDIMARGQPFASLAEFVNSGILQNAIDQVQWRHHTDPTVRTGLNHYLDDTGTSWNPIPQTSPSYLSQGDILAALGSILTARSDTFVIRAYGDVRNPVTGTLDARAYCEAVVQRMPEPLQPVNRENILDNEYKNASMINPASPMGRRFEIISFRWLSPGEV